MQIILIKRLPCLKQSIEKHLPYFIVIAAHFFDVRVEFIDVSFEEESKMFNEVHIRTVGRPFHVY